MNSSFKINSKGCLLCNNEVMKRIGALQGVFGAEVDYIRGIINVQHTDEVSKEDIEKIITALNLTETTDITSCELE